MVQDIYPHKLHNEFDPNVQATQKDVLLCIVNGKILIHLNCLYKKIEGINPRLLLCSTLIDLASIQYFLQPDLHSSQQLLCSYVKV